MFDQKLSRYFLELPEIKYAIAYGSYGRGEESYLISNKKKLYNDIDLILIVDDKEIDELAIKNDLRNILDVRWVDILIWTLDDFSKRRNTIFYYDLMSSYKLLKGDSKQLSKVKVNLNELKISALDVYDMFVTRSWSLLALYGDDLSVDESIDMFKSYQCAKLIISMVDFVLLTHNKYTSKISDKLIALKLLKNKKSYESLILLLEKAITVKFDPSSKSLLYIVNDSKGIEKLTKEYFSIFNKYIKSNSLSYIHPKVLLLLLKLKRCSISILQAFLNRNIQVVKHYIYREKVLRNVHKLTKSDHGGFKIEQRRKINIILNEILK